MRKAGICCIFLVAAVAAGGASAGRAGPSCRTDRVYRLGSPAQAYYAAARFGLRAFDRPDGRPVASFGRLNVNGVQTVFGVLGTEVAADCLPTWFKVQLPMRPNGAIGWVHASSVLLGLVHMRVTVDLSAHLLTLYRDGKPLLRTPVAIGAPGTPTPTGSYYVNQRLLALDPNGPFGFAGIGISAFSPTLTDWVQGGPIAIHGTNDPSSIGRSVSHGCIRVPNEVLHRLWGMVPEGTPVTIVA